MSRTLTRNGLQKCLLSKVGLSKADSESLVGQTIKSIAEALKRGETVKLTGFGTLEVRERGARQGRNPRSGEPYPVSARRVVVFTPSAHLRQRLESEKPSCPSTGGQARTGS